ncbi:MAG: hypothetical protein KY468_00795 [Armatimonadetes bacterium]|nr:hypothetical protein [Armatimonadota bacterium]
MAEKTVSGRLLALPGRNTRCLGWATAVLSWAGYRVDRANTAEEALRMLRNSPYDVLLLGYDSSPEDVRHAIEIFQHPGVHIPTLLFITDDEEFIPPPPTPVPLSFMDPNHSQEELFHMVEKLREFA